MATADGTHGSPESGARPLYPSRAENVFLMRCPPTLNETAPLNSFPFAFCGVRYRHIARPSAERGVPFTVVPAVEPEHLIDLGLTAAPSSFT